MRPAFFVLIFVVASFIIFGSLFFGGIDPDAEKRVVDPERLSVGKKPRPVSPHQRDENDHDDFVNNKNPKTQTQKNSPSAPPSPSQQQQKTGIVEKTTSTFSLDTRFLLSKRYNQDQSDYDEFEKTALEKYKTDLARVDLVKFINGVPIEPIDTMIGLGG